MQQIEAQTVAASSRVAGALLGLLVATSPLTARAASGTPDTPAAGIAPPTTPSLASAPAPPPPVIPPLVTPEHRSYRLALAAAYSLAPFAAVGVGHAISRNGSHDAVVAITAGAIFFTPSIIHIAHGKTGHGVVSFLAMAGLTGAGTVVGAIVGGGIGQAGCDPDVDSDSCDFAAFPGIAIGAFVGGVLTYTGYAIYDVVTEGEVVLPRRSDDQALQLWVRPTPGTMLASAQPGLDETSSLPAGLQLDGLQLGVSAPW